MNSSLRILLIAFLLRTIPFLYVAIFNPDGFLIFDSHGYLDIADNLVQHGAFSRSTDSLNFFPDITRTPVFPFFLAGLKFLGAPVMLISFILVLLGSFNVWLAYKIASAVLKNDRFAFIAGVIIAFDVPSILFSGLIMSETLFTTILLAALYFFLCKQRSMKNLIMSGFLFALLILCRPIAVLLPLLLLFFLWNEKKALKKSLVFIASSYLLVMGWSYRNYRTFDTFSMTSISSLNLYYFTAAPIVAETQNISNATAKKQLSDQLRSSRDWHGTVEEVSLMIDYCREESFNIIKSHPIIFLKQTSIGLMYFFTKPARSYIDLYFGINIKTGGMMSRKNLSIDSLNNIAKTTSPFAIILVIFQLILSCGILVMIVYALIKKQLHQQHFIMLAVILYFAVFSSIAEVDARFRIPVVPLLAILSVLGLRKWMETVSQKKEQSIDVN